MIGMYLFAGLVVLFLIILAAPTLYNDWKKDHGITK